MERHLPGRISGQSKYSGPRIENGYREVARYPGQAFLSTF
jgi:hypothetical protein